ncbi:hypothetical protein SAMN05660297_02706 [Natronincola peptidivorans]|uniref:Uncharacterized protein n=1 Tax=Natronincola peptidivorans TaxID=426128 RepID=A0A1I0F9A8_9FIRM|nr:hypothetical protein [Natronincola peptidivorans]SET54400.1 hypothetical protein SAMN05660297_02706 [Natronincola peptidivorans]
MKLLMKPIEMIAWFTKEGVPTPIKYRLMEDAANITIKVDRVIIRDEEKLAGNKMFIYRCQSILDNTEKIYELKYEINTCKWFLYKW